MNDSTAIPHCNPWLTVLQYHNVIYEWQYCNGTVAFIYNLTFTDIKMSGQTRLYNMYILPCSYSQINKYTFTCLILCSFLCFVHLCLFVHLHLLVHLFRFSSFTLFIYIDYSLFFHLCFVHLIYTNILYCFLFICLYFFSFFEAWNDQRIAIMKNYEENIELSYG